MTFIRGPTTSFGIGRVIFLNCFRCAISFVVYAEGVVKISELRVRKVTLKMSPMEWIIISCVSKVVYLRGLGKLVHAVDSGGRDE